MRRLTARLVLSALVVGGGAVIMPLAAMSTASATVQECSDVAYASGEDIDPYLVNDACSQQSQWDCFSKFREVYGPQQWAWEACSRRD